MAAMRDVARRLRSPAVLGFWVGYLAFLVTLFTPAIYVASRVSRRPGVQIRALTPEEERFLDRVRRDWTEQAGLSRALFFGVVSGITVAMSGYVTRALRRREIGRGA